MSDFILREKTPLREDVLLLRFEGDSSPIQAPGSFVHLSLPGFFLRRPFSVCDWGDGWLTILAERVGDGTKVLHQLSPGSRLDILPGLGRGFDLSLATASPLLIGCGTGLSPLVGLARRLPNPRILLAFRREEDAFGQSLFEGLPLSLTDDLFSALSAIPHDFFYACGSESVMRKLCESDEADGEIAFDTRMGCGVGLCMGCSRETVNGPRLSCKDGPVFRKGELL